MIVASNYGDAAPPAWLRNLSAHPHVRFDGRAYTARLAAGAEHDQRWHTAVDFYAGYAAYARRTRRQIAVVILTPRQ